MPLIVPFAPTFIVDCNCTYMPLSHCLSSPNENVQLRSYFSLGCILIVVFLFFFCCLTSSNQCIFGDCECFDCSKLQSIRVKDRMRCVIRNNLLARNIVAECRFAEDD